METGMGSVPGRIRGQRQAGQQCSTHGVAVPALLTRLPSVTPQATFTLQWGQAQSHKTGRDLPMPSLGLPRVCPAVPSPRAVDMGDI